MTTTMLAYWPFLVGAAALLVGLALAFRKQTKVLIRLGKALATDKRLPRPVRLLFAVAMAIKTVPGPDLGIDEGLLLIGAALLAGPYRKQFKAIWQEVRA